MVTLLFEAPPPAHFIHHSSKALQLVHPFPPIATVLVQTTIVSRLDHHEGPLASLLASPPAPHALCPMFHIAAQRAHPIKSPPDSDTVMFPIALT